LVKSLSKLTGYYYKEAKQWA